MRRVVALNFYESIWVTAEIGQISASRGHLYISLLEKEENEIIAELTAIVWSTEFKRIQRILGSDTEGVFSEGVEVKLKGRLDFHERYGLKLIVEEIDPNYTIGKLELQRRQLIQALQNEKLLGKNADLPLPSVIQNLAVISSDTAAGWIDFENHLAENSYGYRYTIQFFQSAMQGQYVERDMLRQLDIIKQHHAQFDVVIIIRGGGAKLDLVAFDNPAICRAVARFPLPVLTGIGHEVDWTVLDMVAHLAFRTPTAAADFLINQNEQFESKLNEAHQFLKFYVQNRLHTEGGELTQMARFLKIQIPHLVKNQKQALDILESELPKRLNQILRLEALKLDNALNIMNLLSVEATLKRGFSITRQAGRILSSRADISIGSDIETEVSDGFLKSKILE
jgi:exodeoxyribonuclease VII large subunit